MKQFSAIRIVVYSCVSHIFAALLLILFLCNSSFAQTDAVTLSSGKFKPDTKSNDCATCMCICIQASIDFANVHESVAGYPGGYSAPGYKTKVGFNFGAFVTKPILPIGPGQLAAIVGLEFIQKGGKYGSGNNSEDLRLNYIELPIDAIFQYQVMDNGGTVFAGFGPYFAYGVGGKIKYGDGSPSEKAFGGQYGAKHFDFGLQFIGGFKLSCMASISLSYDLGLLNIANNSANSTYSYHDKNRVFSINLAYCLGGLMH